jgi:predicted transcriptional regulator
MANSRKGSTITVALGDDLLTRVNKVAEALHLSAAEFVRNALEEKTKKWQKRVDVILAQEGKIQKEYHEENEDG